MGVSACRGRGFLSIPPPYLLRYTPTPHSFPKASPSSHTFFSPTSLFHYCSLKRFLLFHPLSYLIFTGGSCFGSSCSSWQILDFCPPTLSFLSESPSTLYTRLASYYPPSPCRLSSSSSSSSWPEQQERWHRLLSCEESESTQDNRACCLSNACDRLAFVAFQAASSHTYLAPSRRCDPCPPQQAPLSSKAALSGCLFACIICFRLPWLPTHARP